jgi:hypothetical protein
MDLTSIYDKCSPRLDPIWADTRERRSITEHRRSNRPTQKKVQTGEGADLRDFIGTLRDRRKYLPQYLEEFLRRRTRS